MKYLALGAFLISTALLSAPSRAQESDDDKEWDAPAGRGEPKGKGTKGGSKGASKATASNQDGADPGEEAPKAKPAPAKVQDEEVEADGPAAAPVDEITP